MEQEQIDALRKETYRIRDLLAASCAPDMYEAMEGALFAYFEKQTGMAIDFFAAARASGVSEYTIEQFKKAHGVEEP